MHPAYVTTMFVIPVHRLPPGFAERIETPPAKPAVPRPAATAVLLRDGRTGPEVLLMRRARSSGFMPGAYVFPGGRVDEADADLMRLDRFADPAARAAAPPPSETEEPSDPTSPPPPAYWAAAVREVFEETGVLLALDREGRSLAGAGPDAELAEWREALMQQQATLADLAHQLGVRLALDDVVYFAHWITPLAEARRYDTRFFLTKVPEGCVARPDPREMTDALWLTPTAAVERFRAGRLPMVFPTVVTLESLAGFSSVDEALERWRHRPVRPILPRLVRTAEGVGIIVDDEVRDP